MTNAWHSMDFKMLSFRCNCEVRNYKVCPSVAVSKARLDGALSSLV